MHVLTAEGPDDTPHLANSIGDPKTMIHIAGYRAEEAGLNSFGGHAGRSARGDEVSPV